MRALLTWRAAAQPLGAGRNLANGVRARFLESILKQDAAWHETGADSTPLAPAALPSVTQHSLNLLL